MDTVFADFVCLLWKRYTNETLRRHPTAQSLNYCVKVPSQDIDDVWQFSYPPLSFPFFVCMLNSELVGFLNQLNNMVALIVIPLQVSHKSGVKPNGTFCVSFSRI